jgi:hypothetical protein
MFFLSEPGLFKQKKEREMIERENRNGEEKSYNTPVWKALLR